MIEAALCWEHENISRYVRYTLLTKNGLAKSLLIVYAVLISFITVAGVVVALAVQLYWLIIISALIVLVVVGIVIMTANTIKRLTNEIYTAAERIRINGIQINASCIVMLYDGVPCNIAQWSEIESAEFDKDSAYITTDKGLLLIIEKCNITVGDLEELKKIADEKTVKKGA